MQVSDLTYTTVARKKLFCHIIIVVITLYALNPFYRFLYLSSSIVLDKHHNESFESHAEDGTTYLLVLITSSNRA